MGTFQDELWTELLDEHGPALAGAQRPEGPRRRSRPALVVAGGFGVAGLATVLALTLTATTAAPAFAVTRNNDGSVTVSLQDLLGVSGANDRLASLGVPARVVTIGKDCQTVPVTAIGVDVRRPHQTDPAVITFSVRDIPAGSTELLAAQLQGGRVLLESVMAQMPVDRAPACIQVGLYVSPDYNPQPGDTRAVINSPGSADADPSADPGGPDSGSGSVEIPPPASVSPSN